MTTTVLRAYHGDPAVKTKYLARVRAHRAADRLVQQVGWEHGRGCAIGCTLEAYDHARYPIELGVSEAVAHLEDAIFEGLPRADAMAWPERFLSAIPVGADLSRVVPRFLGRLLARRRAAVEADQTLPADRRVAFVRAIQGVEDVLARWAVTGSVDAAAAEAAAEAAACAARAACAAWAAEAAGAAGAARAGWAARAAEAAGAAGAATRGAAWAAWAAGAAAREAARAAEWQWMAQVLCEELAAC